MPKCVSLSSSKHSATVLFGAAAAGREPRCEPLLCDSSLPGSQTATAAGIESLAEDLQIFVREQVLEDYRVEKPEGLSQSAWQKRQSRAISSGFAKVSVCSTPDEVVQCAATLLKPWNLEAYLYLHICDRATEEPLCVDFSLVEATLYPDEDHKPLPAKTECELLEAETTWHNTALEQLVQEEFGFSLASTSSSSCRTTKRSSRKRTFEGKLRTAEGVIDIE